MGFSHCPIKDTSYRKCLTVKSRRQVLDWPPCVPNLITIDGGFLCQWPPVGSLKRGCNPQHAKRQRMQNSAPTWVNLVTPGSLSQDALPRRKPGAVQRSSHGRPLHLFFFLLGKFAMVIKPFCLKTLLCLWTLSCIGTLGLLVLFITNEYPDSQGLHCCGVQSNTEIRGLLFNKY